MIRNQKSKQRIVPVRSTALSARTKETEDVPLFTVVLKGGAVGAVATLLFGILLISVMTAVAYANPDPASLLTPLSLAALLPSMFAGGFICVKKVKDAPLLCGIVCGGMVTVVTILCSVIMRGLPSSGYDFGQSALLHGLAVLFSVLGAFAGNAKRRSKPAKRRFG